MENKQLIPFSKEIWESGEYEAVTRNNFIVKIYEIADILIYGRIVNEAQTWCLSGAMYWDEENILDLMLRKKTKKVWRPLFETDYKYASKEECEEYCSNSPEGFIKAIEVEIP